MKALRLAGLLIEIRELQARHGCAVEITVFDAAGGYVFVESTRRWRDFQPAPRFDVAAIAGACATAIGAYFHGLNYKGGSND